MAKRWENRQSILASLCILSWLVRQAWSRPLGSALHRLDGACLVPRYIKESTPSTAGKYSLLAGTIPSFTTFVASSSFLSGSSCSFLASDAQSPASEFISIVSNIDCLPREKVSLSLGSARYRSAQGSFIRYTTRVTIPSASVCVLQSECTTPTHSTRNWRLVLVSCRSWLQKSTW